MKTKQTILGAILITTLAAPTFGQSCAPRDMVIEQLADRYGETRQSIGLGSNNAVIEVFASDDTGSWTIIITSAQGLSCLVASGQAFEQVAEARSASGDDA